MSGRYASAWGLVVALFLSGSLGPIDHEHGLRSLQDGVVCTVEHGEAGAAARPAEPLRQAGIDAAAAAHQHDCVACRLARSRCATGALGAAYRQPQLAVKAMLADLGAAPHPGASSSHSARGPPRG